MTPGNPLQKLCWQDDLRIRGRKYHTALIDDKCKRPFAKFGQQILRDFSSTLLPRVRYCSSRQSETYLSSTPFFVKSERQNDCSGRLETDRDKILDGSPGSHSGKLSLFQRGKDVQYSDEPALVVRTATAPDFLS